jgi:hypothetical protein
MAELAHRAAIYEDLVAMMGRRKRRFEAAWKRI